MTECLTNQYFKLHLFKGVGGLERPLKGVHCVEK